MKIIISPSKTQNFNFDNQGKSELKLKKETKLLFSKLKSLSKEELSYCLKIKKNLLAKRLIHIAELFSNNSL